jgi:hypothetical protein
VGHACSATQEEAKALDADATPPASFERNQRAVTSLAISRGTSRKLGYVFLRGALRVVERAPRVPSKPFDVWSTPGQEAVIFVNGVRPPWAL